MADRQFLLLKRKLQALNYNDEVDIKSAQLVENLVSDLMHTTESYRALKLQSGKQLQTAQDSSSKARPGTVLTCRLCGTGASG